MPGLQASWTNGVDIALENKSWSTLRQGFGTTVRPSNESTSGWAHFSIPTPVILNGVRVKAGQALIRFSTGPRASIRAFHVYDGERKISEQNGLNLTGNVQLSTQQLGRPEVFWGTGISLLLDFNGTSQDAWVQLIAAGIDFFDVSKFLSIHDDPNNTCNLDVELSNVFEHDWRMT
jgi:hypothetical protein